MEQNNIEEDSRGNKTLEDYLSESKEMRQRTPILKIISRVHGLLVLSLAYKFSDILVNDYDKLIQEWGNTLGMAAIGYSAMAIPLLAVDGVGDLITGRHHETIIRLEHYISKLLKREITPISKIRIDYNHQK